MGNFVALIGLLATRHNKCVAPKAHAKLARADLLLCRVPAYLRKKTGFPSVNRLSGGGALHVWRAFVIAVAGSAHDGSRVASP